MPYVWRLSEGFTLIGEFGRPDDYDRSQAWDVSDDGTRVVGAVMSSLITNGDPPTIAFLWTATGGTRDLEELLVASGAQPEGLWTASTISGDGHRILATGAPALAPNESASVVLELHFEALM